MPAFAILWNGRPLNRLRYNSASLDLNELTIEIQNATNYNHHLPFYLRTLFPMFGTAKLGKRKVNELYTPRKLTAYLIR